MLLCVDTWTISFVLDLPLIINLLIHSNKHLLSAHEGTMRDTTVRKEMETTVCKKTKNNLCCDLQNRLTMPEYSV